jgi:hypothetical protein
MYVRIFTSCGGNMTSKHITLKVNRQIFDEYGTM